MAAKYPTTIPAYDVLVSNLVANFKRATPEQVVAGLTWYDEARDFCIALSTATPYTLAQVVGVVAVLSPRCTWDLNKRWAIQLLEAHARGDAAPPAVNMTANRDKAWRIACGLPISDNVKGVKVEAFHANITGDNERVTVDRHHFTAACGFTLAEIGRGQGNGGNEQGVTKAENRAIAAATLEAAAICGVSPSSFQAIVWCVIRGNIGE